MTVGPCFRGKAHVEWLEDGRLMRLLEEYAFIDAAQLDWPVKRGAVIDGASIPQILWSFLKGPFEGRYRNASIIHDWYCHIRTRSAHEVHRMFYEAMRASRVSAARARIMYLAVRYAGPRWSDMVTMNARIAFGVPTAPAGQLDHGTGDIPGFGRDEGFLGTKVDRGFNRHFGLPDGVSPWVVRRTNPGSIDIGGRGGHRRGSSGVGRGRGSSRGDTWLAGPGGIAASLEGLASATTGLDADWPAFEFSVDEGKDFACDYVERPGFGGNWSRDFARQLVETHARSAGGVGNDNVLVTLDDEAGETLGMAWTEEDGFGPLQPIPAELKPRKAIELSYGKQLVWQRENVDEAEFERLADIVEREAMTPDEIDQLVREEALPT